MTERLNRHAKVAAKNRERRYGKVTELLGEIGKDNTEVELKLKTGGIVSFFKGLFARGK